MPPKNKKSRASKTEASLEQDLNSEQQSVKQESHEQEGLLDAKDDALDKHLQATEQALQEAMYVKPCKEEIDAIRQFCQAEVAKRSAQEQIIKEIKQMRSVQKECKTVLLTKFGEQSTCIALSKDQVKNAASACASQNVPPMPYFLRLVRANKDSTITCEVIAEALESISEEDIQEASQKAHSTSMQNVIKELVLTNVRRIIRSFTESLKLLSALPKGQSVYDVQEADASTVQKMIQLWNTECKLKDLLYQKKQVVQEPTDVKALKQTIESFFVRTGLTTQRINVEGNQYKLARKVSVRKSKVGIGKLEALLDELLTGDSVGPFRPKELIKTLQIQLNAIPPETKSNVVFSAVSKQSEE